MSPPPTHDLREAVARPDMIEQLRDQARREAEASRKFVDMRFGPTYESQKAEHTLSWKAASELARLTGERDAANTTCDMAAMSGGFHAKHAENNLARALAAEAELATLRARLEIDKAFNAAGEPVAFPEGMPDGIECRDETIRGQDKQIDRLRSKLAALKAAAARDAEERVMLREALEKAADACGRASVELRRESNHSAAEAAFRAAKAARAALNPEKTDG